MSEQAQEPERPTLDSDACRYALEVSRPGNEIDAAKLSQALNDLEGVVDVCIDRGIALPVGLTKEAIAEARDRLTGDLTLAADAVSTLVFTYISRENASVRMTGKIEYRPKNVAYMRD